MNDDELAALVAEKVMGWVRLHIEGGEYSELYGPNWEHCVGTWVADPKLRKGDGGLPLRIGVGIPRYSSYIAAAWKVVERMQANGWQLRLYTRSDWSDAVFSIEANPLAREPGRSGHGVGKNVPTAICLAALSALRVNVTT